MIDPISTDDLRLLISLVIIGQQLLIALVFLKGRPLLRAQWLGALLLLGAASYLVQSNTMLSNAVNSFGIVVTALAIAVPYLLWEFSIAIFEIRAVPRTARFLIYLVPISLWVFVVSEMPWAPPIVDVLEVMHRLFGLAVIAYIVASVYLDRRDDLLEPRRRYRALFVLLIALQAGGVLTVEMLLGNSNFPDWLELTNVVMIELLTLGLSLPLLTLDGRILWQEPLSKVATDKLQPADSTTPANRVLQDALNALMQDGFYRNRDLQINGLAAELKVPEHQLRKLINQRLGYRNFSSFLNHHRIGEAKLHLASAEAVRIPILTIAMDLGYGSIGPFNRAFKESSGLTPSQFRQQKLGDTAADSE